VLWLKQGQKNKRDREVKKASMMQDEEFPMVGHKSQLILKNLLEHAAKVHPKSEVVYKNVVRENYAELYERSQRLSNALRELGAKRGSKIIAFEWNTHRFLEMYFGIPCMGAIVHLGNPLLTPEQIVYLISKAEDEILIFNKDFTPLIESIADRLKNVKHYVMTSDDGSLPEVRLQSVFEYEELLRSASPSYEYPELDEDSVASLTNTTGTTGDPKICFFSHRQHVLHTLIWSTMLLGFSGERGFDPRRDVTIQMVPMFHGHGWCIPYMATYLGCKQLLPGRFIPRVVLDLIRREKGLGQGGYIACVPTMLDMIFSDPEIGEYEKHLKGLIYEAGGIRVSASLARKIQGLGMDLCAGWGLTEAYTKAGLQFLKPHMFQWSEDQKFEFLTRTGMAPPLVQQRVVDEHGKDVPKDDTTIGEIVLRAPWLSLGYLRDPGKSKELWREGWLHTGDIATMDEEESVLIIDRAKDVIKSGGEWISSLTLESVICSHPKVKEAVALAAKSERWGERPIAIVVAGEEYKNQISEEELSAHMERYVEEGRILKWWIPDRFIFAESIPRTSVGKTDKKAMRYRYWKVLEQKEGT
jgi:fatty-acyl-CoA synthase